MNPAEGSTGKSAGKSRGSKYVKRYTKRARNMQAKKRLLQNERETAITPKRPRNTPIQVPNVSTISPPSSKQRSLPERETSLEDMKGRRILTVESINNIVQNTARHAKTCEDCSMQLVSEKSSGLESRLQISCSCGFSFSEGNDIGRETIPLNESTVWASHSAGTGYSTFKTIMDVLEVPMMSVKTYEKLENKAYDIFEEARINHLVQNGKEEYDLSVEQGDFKVVNGQKPRNALQTI